MGIVLALKILEGSEKPGPHGGIEEACNELVREAFWMTDEELVRAMVWARKGRHERAKTLAQCIASEMRTRSTLADVALRAN